MNDNVCLLISSPKSYRDVFEIASELINKNWSDCPYRKVYATDFCDEVSFNGFTVFSFSNIDNWIDRVLKVLEYIPEQYIILPTDDLFFKKEIKGNYFNNAINFMKDNNIKYCRLYKNKHFAKKKNKLADDIYQLYYYQAYAISLLGGIWKKESLIELLSSSTTNSYELESNLQKLSLTNNKEKIERCVYFHNDIFYHAIYKGKWSRGVDKVLKKNNIKRSRSREKVTVSKSLANYIKTLFRDAFSPKARYKIKKITSKFIKYDSEY